MTGEDGINNHSTRLLLPHIMLPHPITAVEAAKALYVVAVMHKMAIGDEAERKNAKYLRKQAFTSGKNNETRAQMQTTAENDIIYWEESLVAAKKAAREACERDLGNIKYLKFLAELEEITI